MMRREIAVLEREQLLSPSARTLHQLLLLNLLLILSRLVNELAQWDFIQCSSREAVKDRLDRNQQR
jgi:hypothetical protein